MKRQDTLQAHQLEEFAQFLEDHPGFSPVLSGEDAFVYGFRIGTCSLSIEETEMLVDTLIETRLTTLFAASMTRAHQL